MDTNINCIVHATLTIIVNKEMGVVWGVVTRNGCGFKCVPEIHFTKLATMRLWQCCAEPWRVVELTAGISSTTPLSIPQGIISIYSVVVTSRSWVACSAEIVVANVHFVWPVSLGVSAGTDTI